MARPINGATRYKGERVQVNISVSPGTRERLRAVRNATGLAYADYVEELIRRDEINAYGVPAWHPAAEEKPEQQKLEMTA